MKFCFLFFLCLVTCLSHAQKKALPPYLQITYQKFDNFTAQQLRLWLQDWETKTTVGKDFRAQVAVLYQKFLERRRLKLTQTERRAILQKMIAISAKHHFLLEHTVAKHYLNFVDFEDKRISTEKMFVEVQKIYETIESIGFQAFEGYELPRILTHLAKFMHDLDSFEKTILYLQKAITYTKHEKKWDFNYVLRLNLLQSIYQKQERYTEALGCAKKILAYASLNVPRSEYETQRANIWRGIALLDIASLLIGMQKLQEAEQYAQDGYKLMCAPKADSIQNEAEFEALQVLMDIKLKLKKITEIDTIIQRCEAIKPFLGKNFLKNTFKQLPYYRNLASFFEAKGAYKQALHFGNLAKQLQDSLNKQYDKNKLQKAQQRLDAEKYVKRIKLIEQEQAFQRTLLYGAVAFLLLLILVVFINYRHLQVKRNLALQSLENYMQAYKEKSELLEVLKEETDKKADEQARHQYLQQLQQATILTQEDWTSFKLLFEKVYPRFVEEHKTLYPDLTPAELRFLMLEKLNLNVNEMANMLGISPNSVHKTQQRLRKKM